MPTQANIQEELTNLNSSLPPHPTNPFVVPAGYFDRLPALLLAKAKAGDMDASTELSSLSPLLASLPKQMPFSLPTAYFETALPAADSRDVQDGALLASVGKEMPYTVPEGYFAQLPQQLLLHTTTSKVKVVPLFSRPWMRIAIAAALGGAVLFGGYQLLNQQTPDSAVATSQPLNPADTNLVAAAPSVQKELKQASTETLEHFIEDVEALPTTIKPSADAARTKASVEALLKDVSSKEVEAFLASLPVADDELLVTD